MNLLALLLLASSANAAGRISIPVDTGTVAGVAIFPSSVTAYYFNSTGTTVGLAVAGTSVFGGSVTINGAANFGSGATKSTFNATGSIQIPNNTGIGAANASGSILTLGLVNQANGIELGQSGQSTTLPGEDTHLGSATFRSALGFTGGNGINTQLTVAASTLTVQGNAFSVGVTTLVVTGGQVGIGTTSPQTTLDTNGSAQFGSGATKSTFAATGALTLATNTLLTIDSATTRGNVGLGTASPLAPLDVAGAFSFRTAGTFASSVTVRGGHGNFVELQNTTNADIWDLRSDAQGFKIQTGANSAMMVDRGNLNVGIGTGTPQTALDVAGSASFGAGATKSTFSTTGALTLATNTLLTIDSGTVRGNIGIGTSTVNGTLEVNANASGNFASGSIGILSANVNTVKNWAIGSGRGSNFEDLSFWAANKNVNPHANGTQVLTLGGGSAATSFNVGVGVDLPQAKLDVNGSASFGSGATKSTFTATGNLTMDPAAKVLMGSRTKAQLKVITPVVGDMYYCSDCSDPTSSKATVVIATGTSAGNFGTLPVGAFQ